MNGYTANLKTMLFFSGCDTMRVDAQLGQATRGQRGMLTKASTIGSISSVSAMDKNPKMQCFSRIKCGKDL